MIQEALKLVDADAVISVVDDSHLPDITPLKLLKVHLQTMQKQVPILSTFLAVHLF